MQTDWQPRKARLNGASGAAALQDRAQQVIAELEQRVEQLRCRGRGPVCGGAHVRQRGRLRLHRVGVAEEVCSLHTDDRRISMYELCSGMLASENWTSLVLPPPWCKSELQFEEPSTNSTVCGLLTLV